MYEGYSPYSSVSESDSNLGTTRDNLFYPETILLELPQIELKNKVKKKTVKDILLCRLSGAVLSDE